MENAYSWMNRKSGQSGFSMLEILITLVVVATALLGTAGLQLYAMKVGKNSEMRTHAILLASDLAERMEANKPAAILALYAASSAAAVSSVMDCSASACNSDNLAEFDLSEWEAAVQNTLPQSNWNVIATVSGTPPTVVASYDIRIGWADRDKSSVPFYYTTTRKVHYCPPAVSGCN